jgi:hypothetical protein
VRSYGGRRPWRALVLTGAARRLSARRASLQLGLTGVGWWWEVAGALLWRLWLGPGLPGRRPRTVRTASALRRAAAVACYLPLPGRASGVEVAVEVRGGAGAARRP